MLAGLALIALGAWLVWLGLLRPVTVIVDGQALAHTTRRLTAGDILHEMGLPPSADDRLNPPAGAPVGWRAVIRMDRSRTVQLWRLPAEEPVTFQSTARIPGNILAQQGVKLYPGDRVLFNGENLDEGTPLRLDEHYDLQFIPAAGLILHENGQARLLFSGEGTLGAALWEAGIRLDPADRLDPPPGTPLSDGLEARLTRAVEFTILIGGQSLAARSAASTVGEALAEASAALQGLDYSQPAEDSPLPAGGQVRVVRAAEQVLLEQKLTPYGRTVIQDAETELDQTRVVTPGRSGVQVVRTRVRFEDGVERARAVDSEWTASEPQDEVIGTGTKVVVRSLDTPGGPVEYWRAITVYATSYSPCNSGTEKCYSGTSYGLPVQRGVIGVTRAWYNLLAGQRVYVPGYGSAVIADVGGGIPGRRWIDLGFSDADFEAWHQTVTLYFLTPIPDNIPWSLP